MVLSPLAHGFRALRRALLCFKADTLPVHDLENQHGSNEAGPAVYTTLEKAPLRSTSVVDRRVASSHPVEQTLVDGTDQHGSRPGIEQAAIVSSRSPAEEPHQPPSSESASQHEQQNAEEYEFDGDDETDCASGPPRMIVAKDNGRECAALLLTFKLSRLLQEGARNRRLLMERKRAYQQLGIDIGRLERQELKLEYELERSYEQISEDVGLPEAGLQLIQDLEEIGGHLQESRRLFDAAQAELGHLQSHLDVQKDDILAEFDDISVGCKLLDPRGSPSIEQSSVGGRASGSIGSLQGEQQMLQRSVNAAKAGTTIDPGTALIRSYHECKRALDAAEEEFDNKDDEYETALTEYAERCAAGEPVESGMAFDHAHLLEGQRLTRRLIEKEEDFARAKQAAVDASIDPGDITQRSGFADDASDGYCLSAEEAQVASVSRPYVYRWLDGVPEAEVRSVVAPDGSALSEGTTNYASADISADLDEWEARSVDICDSTGMVAEDADRRHIDRWQAACDLLRNNDANVEVDVLS